MKKLAFMLGVAVLPLTNIAASASLEACTEILDDKARLTCYDALAKDGSAQDTSETKPTSAKDNEETFGRWEVNTKKNPIDDSLSVFLRSQSLNEVRGTFETTVPTLLIRCRENETDMYIAYDQTLEFSLDGMTGKVRLDDDKPQTLSFTRASSLDAAFFQKPVTFIKEMLGHKKMLVQINLHGTSGQIAEFDLNGLEGAIKPLREACNW